MSISPMQKLAHVLRQHGLIRFIEHYAEEFPTSHLKDLIVDELGPHREMAVQGHPVVNFGDELTWLADIMAHDFSLSPVSPFFHSSHSPAIVRTGDPSRAGK